jgi:translation initiation factor 2-alpha kinase 3
MSSFFRAADDVTDSRSSNWPEDSGTGADDGGESDLSSSQVIYKVPTHDSTISIGEDNHPATLTSLGGSSSSHRDMLLHSLLEGNCIREAIAELQESSGGNRLFTTDDPEVIALAGLKYQWICKSKTAGNPNVYPPKALLTNGSFFTARQLSKAGFAPSGPEQEGSRQLREAYRTGLDILSRAGPEQGKPGLASRKSSTTAALNQAFRNVMIDNTRRLSTYQIERLAHYQNFSTLPDLVQPLVDHPMFELSRYRREFSEVGIIGKGGYGKVYRVKHKLDGSEYAVKKITLSKCSITLLQNS